MAAGAREECDGCLQHAWQWIRSNPEADVQRLADVREMGSRMRPQGCLEQLGSVTQKWGYQWSKLGIRA